MAYSAHRFRSRGPLRAERLLVVRRTDEENAASVAARRAEFGEGAANG